MYPWLFPMRDQHRMHLSTIDRSLDRMLRGCHPHINPTWNAKRGPPVGDPRSCLSAVVTLDQHCLFFEPPRTYPCVPSAISRVAQLACDWSVFPQNLLPGPATPEGATSDDHFHSW